MGMFDDILCEAPLPDGFNGSLQTKDLGCCMKTHVITADGRLMVDEAMAFEYPAKIEDANFHGVVNFYGGSTEDWHEYEARFTDGNLVEIYTVKQSECLICEAVTSHQNSKCVRCAETNA